MSVFVRIVLRYGAGFLVARGLLGESDGSMLAADPEVASFLEMAGGAALGAISEAWYMFARKLGWSK
jgi:hypothetical protein